MKRGDRMFGARKTGIMKSMTPSSEGIDRPGCFEARDDRRVHHLRAADEVSDATLDEHVPQVACQMSVVTDGVVPIRG